MKWQNSSRGIDSGQVPGVQTHTPVSGPLFGPLNSRRPLDFDGPAVLFACSPQSARSEKLTAL